MQCSGNFLYSIKVILLLFLNNVCYVDSIDHLLTSGKPSSGGMNYIQLNYSPMEISKQPRLFLRHKVALCKMKLLRTTLKKLIELEEFNELYGVFTLMV